MKQIIAIVVALGLLQVAPWAQERKFYPDDPLLVDNDQLDVPDEPAEIALSDMFDRFGHNHDRPRRCDPGRGAEREHARRGA